MRSGSPVAAPSRTPASPTPTGAPARAALAQGHRPAGALRLARLRRGDGRIRDAYSSNGGISLYLDADNGETYFYAHNSANVVKSGRVEAGQLIARVGSTGNAGGTNHVHFEREVGGRSVNPYAFLRRIC
jgi:murein DD-endopeptidase MepM/ murein hydrolase activator NlpD